MAIQTKREKLEVISIIFQARYSDGYRLMDRSGVLLNHIKKEMPEWLIGPTASQLLTFRHHDLPIKANIGTGAMDLSWEGKQASAVAEKNCERFAHFCQAFYELTTSRLELERTTRLGIRYHILAPADSVEEADRVVCRALRSPFQELVGETLKMSVVDGSARMFFEDSETGIRRMIGFRSVYTDVLPGAPEPMGFKSEPGQGTGGLEIDIDTYTRPESGHVGKIEVWIQEQLLKALQWAPTIFLWPIQH